MSAGLSRRALLGGFGGFGAGAATGALSGHTGWDARSPSAASTGQIVAFYGSHQAGIVTPAQDRLVFGSLNVVPGAGRNELREMLRSWTAAAVRMTRGQLVGEVDELTAPPIDTGEAVGSPVSRLTITIGYGPSLFDHRFGLSHNRPALLKTLPVLPNEELDPAYEGGDIAIQACSDDPLDRFVWVGEETDQRWLRGGSYLVVRKIRMFLENWDRDYLGDQHNVIGRAKISGGPLSGGTEFTTPDFAATDSAGTPVITMRAHIRLAGHEDNDGLRILRRGYSYTDGIDPQRGTLVGGLLFLAYMAGPGQFIALQTKLGQHDALNEYISHVGSALFACPPGLAPGQSWGDALFA